MVGAVLSSAGKCTIGATLLSAARGTGNGTVTISHVALNCPLSVAMPGSRHQETVYFAKSVLSEIRIVNNVLLALLRIEVDVTRDFLLPTFRLLQYFA